MGTGVPDKGAPSNTTFALKIKGAIDLIEARTPKIFSLMTSINPKGRRIIYYTGKIGPASFVS